MKQWKVDLVIFSDYSDFIKVKPSNREERSSFAFNPAQSRRCNLKVMKVKGRKGGLNKNL